MGGSRVIRVTNIAPQATRDQMQTLFTFVGKVEEIKLYPTIRDVAIPVASRVSFVKFVDRDHVGIAQHLNNTVFIDRALIIVPYEKPDIPDEHTAMQALVQSNGVMGVTNEQQLPAHVTNVVDGAYYITKDQTFAEHGVPEYPSLPCTLEYGQVEEIRRTVVVGNLAPSTDAHQVMEWLADAGEIKYARMCGRDSDESRACLIEFSEQASIIPAMLKSGQQMGDRSLVVAHASLGIAKPQIKTNEMAQREIEEAMRRAQEQQSLISSTMQPVTSYMDDAKRSRSRERGGRRRRSRSRDRRRRSRSRSPRRSRSRYSPIRDRRRSRSRDRKSRSRRSRSRSRDRSRRHRSRSRSREKRRDDKDRRGSSRDKDRRDKDKNRDKDKDRGRDKDKEKSDKSRSKDSPEKDIDAKERGDKSISPSKEKSSKESSSRARSRSPAKKRSRSRSADRRRAGRGSRSSPSRRRSRSRSRHRHRRSSRSPGRRRSRSPGRKRSRSPRGSHSRSQRSPEPKRRDRSRERDKDRKRDKDRRDKDHKSEKMEAKVSRDYDEEEKGFDEDVKRSVSRETSPAEKGREERSAATGDDDMDISE